jgi:hypothetical protein
VDISSNKRDAKVNTAVLGRVIFSKAPVLE